MPAPIGNTYSKGHRGNNDRLLAARVRTKALMEMERILDGNNEAYKKEVVLKLTATVLPRLNEHTGEDGAPLIIPSEIISKYGLIAHGAEGNSTEQTPVQGSELRPEIRQDDTVSSGDDRQSSQPTEPSHSVHSTDLPTS